ncbi:MAG: AmmeMemoRadiSam system protein A [Chloroflexi bacterium]|nr:AmmeMemoRadiSam system protein A [Chloroflexota bacterium]
MNAYTPEQQRLLLAFARQTLQAITAGEPAPTVDLNTLPPELREPRACFVTLRHAATHQLRGCTGTLVARRPLAQEVVFMTMQTACHDPRFFPVTPGEVPELAIEISVLTPPQTLVFSGPDDLVSRLRPGVDGVTLMLNNRRATFLPQVWLSYPDPCVFLDLLCEKMGGLPGDWRSPQIEVETYEAIVIEETGSTALNR